MRFLSLSVLSAATSNSNIQKRLKRFSFSSPLMICVSKASGWKHIANIPCQPGG